MNSLNKSNLFNPDKSHHVDFYLLIYTIDKQVRTINEFTYSVLFYLIFENDSYAREHI